MEPDKINVAPTPTNRLPEGACNALDVAKLLFALIVVGIHQQPCHGEAYVYTWHWFGRLAVPFFFVTSAFLFFQRQPGPAQLRKYVVRMLKLYAFWFVVMLPYTIHLRWDTDMSVVGNVLWLVRRFLLDSTFAGSWFLSALLIAIPLVYWSERRFGMRFTVLAAVGIELFLQAYGWRFAMPDAVAEALTSFDEGFPSVHCSWMAAVIYVVAGNLIAKHWESVERISARRWWCAAAVSTLILAGWVICMSEHLFIDDRTLLRVPVVVLIFISVVRSNLQVRLPYRSLRKASTIFYISHFLFIYLLTELQINWLEHMIPDGWRYVVVLLTCSVLSWVLITLQRRRGFKWLQYAW